MDILIETSTSAEINRWNGSPDKVRIPGTAGDVIFVKGVPRPINVGPGHFLATAQIVEPPLGPDQKRGLETTDVTGQVVKLTRPAIDLTAQEIADRDRRNDEGSLRQGGLKLAHVLVELVAKLLANGTISGTDFTPETKQMYQDVKAIADRLKA